jgi:hypothetical protein
MGVTPYGRFRDNEGGESLGLENEGTFNSGPLEVQAAHALARYG